MLLLCFKKTFRLILLLVCCGVFPCISSQAAPVSSTAMGARSVVEQTEHFLLMLDAQADAPELSREMKQNGVSLQDRHRYIYEELKQTAASSQPPVLAALADMQKNGSVLSYTPFFISNIIAVECLRGMRPYLEQIPGVFSVEKDEAIELIDPREGDAERPSDPRNSLDEANGLYQIRANLAWSLGVSGNGVLVANIDTGVDGDHPALASHWRGSLSHPAEECWLDLKSPFTLTPDGHINHGTQTMGIICGMVSGDTIGVAWGATFIGAEIDFTATVLTSQALQAFEWMLDPDGNPATFEDVPRVISNSWGFLAGSDPCAETFNAAIDNCEAAGTAVVWAAGNDGPNYGTIRNPANRAESPFSSFAVGGYDFITGDVYAESSRGPSPCSTDPELKIKPEIIAPARNVRSALLNGGYGLGSGTSFSVPHVAGTMALMLEANQYLDPDSLKELICLSAVDMGEDGNDNHSGYGNLDAYFAVYAALSGIGWIEGTITDEFGTPVQTEIYLPEHPHRFFSDENGHFLFAVPAWMPFEVQVVVPTQEVYTSWFWADPQDTVTFDIDLVASMNGTLTGTVIDCQGLPAVGAQVEILNAAVYPVTTDANGRFLFSLPAGFYNLRASTPLCGQTVVNNIQVITAGITDIEVVLPLNPNFVCSDPDNYGYRACDSNDPEGPIFNWVGLAAEEGGNGVQLNLIDDGSEEMMLPFPVTFYGETYDRIWINANGNFSFGSKISTYINSALPLSSAPAAFGFWDDYDDTIDGPGGSILARYVPDEAAFIIEWFQIPRFRPLDEDAGRATFQMRIYDTDVRETLSGNSVIEIVYGDIDSTDFATVGLDADNDTDYLQYVCDGMYDDHATPISNGLAVRFTAGELLGASPSLSVSNTLLELSLEPGESMDTVITLMNLGAGALGYHAVLNDEAYASGSASQIAQLPIPGAVQASRPKSESFIPRKGLDPVFRPEASTLDAGGPDGSGYFWLESQDPGGPDYEFTDISLIGEPTCVTEDDMISEPFELPWEFEFYDQKFTTYTINSNGHISFWSIYHYSDPVALTSSGTPFSSPFYMIAPLWIDLDPSAGGSIKSYFDSVTDRFILQWTDVARYGRPGSESTFQIVLHHDGTIDLVYAHVGTNTQNIIIGIKGGHEGDALPVGFGQNYIRSDMMVRIFRPVNETASCEILDHSYGVILPGQSRDIPIRVANYAQASGLSSWPLTIRSTDPSASNTTIEVVMMSQGQIDADLTISKQDDNILLNWKTFPTAFYCVYSGTPEDQALTHFEGMTADTFFAIPFPEEEARLYEIRLCTQTAAPQDTE